MKSNKVILHPLAEKSGFPRELLIWLLHNVSFRQTLKNIYVSTGAQIDGIWCRLCGV